MPPMASFREQVARGARVKPFSERIDRAGLISGLVVSLFLPSSHCIWKNRAMVDRYKTSPSTGKNLSF